jgi:hypothetical protein
MPEYQYVIDRKVMVWNREYHTIEANNQEEADSIVIAVAKRETENQVDEWDTLLDTEQDMSVNENNGLPTIEVMRDNDEKKRITIWENK